MTRESLVDGKDTSARVSFKQEALLSLSLWGRTRVLLGTALWGPGDCCPYVSVGCSESVGSFVTWELMACDGLKGCGIEDGSVVYRGLVVCSRAVGCVFVEDGPVGMRRLFVRRVKSSCSEVRSL